MELKNHSRVVIERLQQGYESTAYLAVRGLRCMYGYWPATSLMGSTT
jgi:hypothetical protein